MSVCGDRGANIFEDISGRCIIKLLGEGCLLKFSIALCVNKDNPWLNKALDSVLAQDDPDFEFLIAANACSDDLWESLQSVARRDPRVRIFRTSIGQLSFNLNFLADQAVGDYLVRMDADDWCEPHRLSTLRRVLAQDPVDILGSSVLLIDAADKPIGRMDLPESRDDIVRALLTRTAFCHPAVAIRRQFLIDMRGYLGGFHSEDTEFWLRAKRAGATMKNIPDLLFRYRVHNQQSIASRAGYAEVAAHWLKELLISPSWYNLRGFGVALMKSLFVRFLPGIRRYKAGVSGEKAKV